MAERLQDHEIESLMRSAAMAQLTFRSGPRPILEACKAIAADESGLEELLARPGPAWGELREVLKELARGGRD